jgi:Ni/Fe-hydrogenase subunit HybB-like protein
VAPSYLYLQPKEVRAPVAPGQAERLHRLSDVYRKALLRSGPALADLTPPGFFFYLELFGTVALPAILLSIPDVRRSVKGLYCSAGLAAFGVVLNRFNVSLTSYGGYRTFSYFPSLVEIVLTLSLIAAGILIFDWGTSYLPVYKSELIGKPKPAVK